MKRITFLLLAILSTLVSFGDTPEELAAIANLRTTYSKSMYRSGDLDADSYVVCIAQLQSNGQFSDFIATETLLKNNNSFKSTATTAQGNAGDFLLTCFERIWRIAENFRGKAIPDDIRIKLYQSILYYGDLETTRPNVGGRFHRSCFAIPVCAINTYFSLFSTMELIENGTIADSESVAVNAMLKKLGMQTWTQPYRNDATDANVVSVERFRGHVWWVGGNAIAYRSLLPVAAMHQSAAMISVISQVAKGALSTVSQTTYNSAFWIEGFTTDGAGWGHGKQCLVWGYPSDGATSALDLLVTLTNTPWVKSLDRSNIDVLLNYIRRSAFYFHNGYEPPLFERGNANANIAAGTIRSKAIAEKIFKSFPDMLKADELIELNLFINQAAGTTLRMTNYPNGNYNGSRYFFNNDDMIKKNRNYMVLVNMASSRVSGLESAIDAANGYNLYSCDGTTLYQRSGDEYAKAIGAMNQSALPGITTRQIDNSALVGITNWSGFNSKHNFAAGATSFGSNFACGFLYEKQDASGDNNNQNPRIYGVKAYKSYFMFGDLMVAMGAGITNLNTALAGNIVTSVEQTLRKSDLAIDGTRISAPTYIEILKSASDNSAPTKWVLNNGFAFGVLPAYTTGEVKVVAETRNTIWKKLAPAMNTAAETTMPMMQLQIDHGKTINNGTYIYLVSATGTVPTKLPEIILNTTSLQAAAVADSSVIAAIFHNNTQGLSFGNYSYNLSSPVAFLIENYNSDSISITVTDATMNSYLKKTTLTTTLPISGANVTKIGTNYSLDIDLPQNELCGSPVTVKVKRIKNATDIQTLVDRRQLRISGHTVYFPSPINQLSVFNMLGVNMLRAENTNSCTLPKSGVYILKMDGKLCKIIIGNN